MDCTAESYNDSIAAYQRLLKDRFDVISLDHRMPKLTGMGLLELLRTTPGPNQRTPALIFSGFREEAEKTKTEALDGVLFLEKPAIGDRYLKNLRIALEMRRK
jgi:CheY-like chemotaxis protein